MIITVMGDTNICQNCTVIKKNDTVMNLFCLLKGEGVGLIECIKDESCQMNWNKVYLLTKQ